MFKEYRSKQLGRVGTLANEPIKLKVIGSGGTESKWLDITDVELEKIMAVLEPEDYRQAVEPGNRVSLPDFGMVTETVAVYYAVSETGNRSIAATTLAEAAGFVEQEPEVWVDTVEDRRTVRYDRHAMDRKARAHCQEDFENVSIGAWTDFDCWQHIKENYIGGRDKFLIDNE